MSWSAINETMETPAKTIDRQKRRYANPTRHQLYATTEIYVEEVQSYKGGQRRRPRRSKED
jgi:hypothetical protein